MVRAGYGVGVWKELRKVWDLVAGKRAFEEGNGSRVLFWKISGVGQWLCVILLSPISLLLLLTKTL